MSKLVLSDKIGSHHNTGLTLETCSLQTAPKEDTGVFGCMPDGRQVRGVATGNSASPTHIVDDAGSRYYPNRFPFFLGVNTNIH